MNNQDKMTLPPQAQAIKDYRQGGGLHDYPGHYTKAEREVYFWQMHRLQVDELKRMRESI